MSEKILTPVFITEEIAKKAVSNVQSVIMNLDGDVLNRTMCHIVVLVPSMEEDQKWPNYQIKPCALYQQSLGSSANWPHKFDEIARCKALQLWHGRNDDRTDCVPHLLFPGDTPYWGGVKRHGIVVACSGFQPHFDKMFSGMIADIIIALAYNEWAKSKESLEGDFLPE